MRSCHEIPGALLLLALALPSGRSAAQAPATIYSEDSVPAYTLPDPLVLESGERVTTARQWWQQRRPELLHLFEEEVYGKAPGRPAGMRFELRSVDSTALGGKATRKEVRVYFTGREDGPKMDILLYLPNQRTGPVATFLGLNFHGNHAVADDPGITLSDAWMLSSGKGVVNRRATEASRGTNAGPWQVDRILARGYGLATVYYGDLDPDFNDGFHNGIHPAFYRPGQTHPDPDQWASIGAWSWGLSRALDYLETDPDVDAKRVAVIGHSRLGKAALWAAAQDQRFAMAISNESGAGGAALSKRIYGETVERLNSSFPHWFAGNFRKYSNHEAALPVDQHELLALIAPRPLYVASAVGDQWSDPRGEFLGAKGAEPVYYLLGAGGLPASEMPAVDHPVAGTIGYHIRSGNHDVTAYDWEQYLDFADARLRPVKPAPAAARPPAEDLLAFHHPSTGEFMAYVDAPNSLYHHLSATIHQEMARRAAEVARLKTPDEWRERQRIVRERLQAAVGAFPERTPLNARVVGTVRKDGIRVEKLVYESRPGNFVTGALFLPAASSRPAPAILYLSGHAADAFRSAAYQQVILNLVRKGFVVLAIDPPGQGERVQYLDSATRKPRVPINTLQHSYVGAQFFLTGGTLAREMIWDGIRAIDYLATRREVDAKRIGVTGRSGGGTLSAYVAAFDPRVLAAAPENYVTSFRRLWETHGPQDGEQHFYRTNASGLDQADFLLARAPRPTLLVTTTRDIFSIQGARETFREMKPAFEALGAPDGLRMVEDDATHESTLKNREAVYAFFQSALGLPGDPRDEQVERLSAAELQVTPTGQVVTSLGGKSEFDLARAAAAPRVEALQRARADESYLERALQAARALSGYRDPGEPAEPIFVGRYQRSGYAVEKYILPVEGGYPTPFLLMVPNTAGPHPAVIYLHPDGKQAEALPGGEMEWLVRQGYLVAAPDLVGTGEMGPGYFKGDSYDVGVGKAPYGLWFGAQDAGESFVGLRAADVVRLFRTIRARPDVVTTEVRGVARGAAAPVLQYAAAFEPAIAGVALVEPLLSYADVALTEYYDPAFVPGAVAGMLTAYDLPDLSAAIAPRRQILIDPLDAAGGPATASGARTEMAAAISRYAAPAVSDRFDIVTAGPDSVRPTLGRWLQRPGWRADPEVVRKTTAAQPGFNFEEAKVGSYTLPDPLASAGSRVRTPAEWRARRAEILELFRENVYGRSPGRPETLRFEVLEENPRAMDGAATLKRISVVSGQSGREHRFDLTLFLPNARPGRVPVFLLLNNRAASNTDPTRGEKSGFWPAEEIIARGYGIAALQVQQLAPDKKAHFREGVIQLFEGTATGPRPADAWGALAAWAWGASRAMDYFETDPRIDATKVAVIGHSRGGKAALWTGAEDERFAFVISNDSGEGGAALSRRDFGETVTRINTSFPHWFDDDYKRFNGRPAEMPTDQHMLISLIAPRAVYVASADEDLWSDPRGEFLSLAASSPVFALWGDPAIGAGAMPPLDTPLIVGRRGYHIRTGGHNLTPWDWARYADFADRLWRR